MVVRLIQKQSPSRSYALERLGLPRKGDSERQGLDIHANRGEWVHGLLWNQGRIISEPLYWGFIPYWLRTPQVLKRDPWATFALEAAPDSRVFRHQWRHQRCIIPVDAFTVRSEVDNIQFLVEPIGEPPLLLAGLWDFTQTEDTKRELKTFALLGQESQAILRQLTTRSPVFIPDGQLETWLFPMNIEQKEILKAIPKKPPRLKITALPDGDCTGTSRPVVWNGPTRDE